MNLEALGIVVYKFAEKRNRTEGFKESDGSRRARRHTAGQGVLESLEKRLW